MLKSSLIAFLGALVFFASGEDTTGSVITLTVANFTSFLDQNPISLVKFTAPGCIHCQKLAPEFENAAKELKKLRIPVSLADVDATQELELAKKYEIEGYPTILFFEEGAYEPYNQGRSTQDIVDWLKQVTGPAVQVVNSLDEADNMAGDASHYVVGHFKSVQDKEYALFNKVAKTKRSKGPFFAIVDPEIASTHAQLHRRSEGVFSTKIGSDVQLGSWIERESIPYFGPVNGKNYKTYANRSENWFWFASNAEDYEAHAASIRAVSKNYRTDFNFVWLDSDTLGNHAKDALGIQTFPGLTVVWAQGKYRYGGNFTEMAMIRFINSVKAGRVMKYLKSEPVPTDNTQDVKVVVGSQFAEIVLQKKKDVFLEVYAPWCGHCKALSPTWERLAKATNAAKECIIAKLDGTANEIDVPGFDFEAFPKLFYVKAGSKTPMVYDGERTFEALWDYVNKQAPDKIDENVKEEL